MANEPKKTSYLSEFTKGIVKENPVFRLVLGTCPTLAVTTAAMNAIGMGAAATVVLIGSNVAISLLRNVIPDKVRIPCYITIIAGFVSVVQMIVKAYAPSIDQSLGIYLPLIVVNCIILGRAEMFTSKNRVLVSAIDGFGMGVGFTASLLAMGIIREILGAGSIFGVPIYTSFMPSMIIFILPPGGFFVFGMMVALVNRLTRKKKGNKAGCTTVEEFGCGACPMASSCGKINKQEEGNKNVD